MAIVDLIRHLLRRSGALSQQRRRHLHRRHPSERLVALQPALEYRSGIPRLRSRRPPGSVRVRPTSRSPMRPAIRAAAAATASGRARRDVRPARSTPAPRTCCFAATAMATFSDVSEKAGLLAARPAFGFHAARPRLRQRPLARRLRRQRLHRVAAVSQQRMTERSRTVGLQAGVALTADGRAEAGMGVSAGDYDRDGWLRHRQDELRRRHAFLVSQPGPRPVRRCDARSGIGCQHAIPRLGCGFLDVDLDSWPDILIVNGHVYPEADRLGGQLQLRAAEAAVPQSRQRTLRGCLTAGRAGAARKKASRGAAFGDLFNTGMQDVVVNNMHDPPQPAAQLRDARGPRAARSSSSAPRSNRSAIGARVTVYGSGRRLIDEVRSGGGFCSHNDLRIHMGLGSQKRADDDRNRLGQAAQPRRSPRVDARISCVVIREGERRAFDARR